MAIRVVSLLLSKSIEVTSQQVETLFDRFYRAVDAKYASRGLGLGMGILRQIIVDHGEDLSVSSTPDEGTTVTFTLPIKQ